MRNLTIFVIFYRSFSGNYHLESITYARKKANKSGMGPRGGAGESGLKTDLREVWHIEHIEIVRFWGLIICKTGVANYVESEVSEARPGHPAGPAIPRVRTAPHPPADRLAGIAAE